MLIAPRILIAQERGAIALGELVDGLGVNTRVLMVGAHPDDEDTFLISWLSRGRHVQTAYLSLTRGDGGQNLIGNELGEALGVIRTEELLAARRIDGAQQYFTRAFDFGFSKDTIDTFRHWDREAILGDVVAIVRRFRPHVIVPVFSGTPRDGHGHHQVSGVLAREAFRLAADTVRFPRNPFGAPWTPLKLYGNARYDPTGGETMRFDVGEYSPLLGRSFAEVAADSRSQHKSQGFGTPIRKGPLIDALRREATRVNDSTPAAQERSIFDGMDTTLARFRAVIPEARLRATFDSLLRALGEAKAAFNPREPARMLPALERVLRLARAAGDTRHEEARWALARLVADDQRAIVLASGIDLDAIASRDVYATGEAARAIVTVYHRGRDTIRVGRPFVASLEGAPPKPQRVVPPASVVVDTIDVRFDHVAQPWWLELPRIGDMYRVQQSDAAEALFSRQGATVGMLVSFGTPGAEVVVEAPVVARSVDAIKGEVRQRVVGAPSVSVTVQQPVQYAPAQTDFRREVTVQLRLAADAARDVRVVVDPPPGLTTDSLVRTVRLEPDRPRTVTLLVQGRLAAGTHRLAVRAETDDRQFAAGYDLIDYDHIRRQRIYHPAQVTLAAVDMRVPASLRVAYVTGVGDNVAPMLTQLGIPVTMIPAGDVSRADLQPYTTVVIGPRAYEAHPELAAANARLLDFARRGGTVVVQYGQYEMTQPLTMPYPITLSRPADRVTEEDAPVTIDAPDDKLLRAPNRIDTKDFAGWVQERALYMPRTFDPRYRSLLSMHDTGEPPQKGAILVAPIGDGQYVYTTLSLFRQLPAGVPGAARLFLNLLSASIPTTSLSP